MTDQKLMQLVEEAGFSAGVRHTEEDVIHFAKLVAELEREECAKLCDYERAEWNSLRDGWYAANYCAVAIRARGEKES